MKILAIDLGDVRTGVAISDSTEFLASPLGTIYEADRDLLLQKIIDIVAKHNVKKIVLGVPKNMDGSEGESAQKSYHFAEMLCQKSGVEVTFQDERGTTLEASNYLNASAIYGEKRKHVIDSVAATIILQSYLDSKRSS